MAFVLQNFIFTIAFADNSGAVSTRTYETQDTDLAAVTALLDDWATTFAAVTDAEIVSYSLTQRWIEDTVVLPAIGVQNENQAIVSAKILGDPTESAVITLPAPKSGVFVGQSGPSADVVNIAAQIVINWLGLFLDGGAFYVSDGENPVAPFSGRRRHVKNSAG